MPTEPSQLAKLLAEMAAESGQVTLVRGASGTEYQRGGQTFAVAHADDSVELRLRADIADAARRTPDTSDSSRGEEWVRFAPRAVDDHARDRLKAWFLIAWRAAAE
jgi:hypothetical protein